MRSLPLLAALLAAPAAGLLAAGPGGDALEDTFLSPRGGPHGCGILWFYHVPKCGGNSVAMWFKMLRAFRYVAKVHKLFKTTNETIDFDGFFNTTIAPFLANPGSRLIAVHHHHHGPGLARATAPPWALMRERLEARGCRLVRFTILRDPARRLESLLQFVSRDDHGEPKSEWRHVLERSRGGEVDNGLLRYVLYNQRSAYPNDHPLDRPMTNESVEEALAALSDFEVVGRLESLSSDLERVAKLAGISQREARLLLRSTLHINHSPRMGEEELSDLRPLIEARVAMDRELYRRL